MRDPQQIRSEPRKTPKNRPFDYLQLSTKLSTLIRNLIGDLECAHHT
jgi:hypothetical protein